MEPPNLIKDNKDKNWFVFYMIYMVVLVFIGSTLERLFTFEMPDGLIVKLVMIPIILHFMLVMNKSKTLKIPGKLVHNTLFIFLIVKLFVDMPIIDAVLNWLLYPMFLWLGIDFLIKKRKAAKQVTTDGQ
ncbi:MAG: hypothetical protein DRP42_04245 [Tenericutes bacterium]|nr:MAG: hypothetical protein DRP42_04245 [Mycoplasmatota bacterium]